MLLISIFQLEQTIDDDIFVLSEQFYFSRLFPLFQVISCHYTPLYFALIGGILRYVWFLSTQLHLRDTAALLKDVSGSQAGRCFPLFSDFPLLTSHLSDCPHGKV